MSARTDIEKLLAEAAAHDRRAQELRREAGWMLAERRSQDPMHWFQVGDLDKRTADLLCQMALGSRPIG